MLFCDNCGHKNRESAKFCQGCGEKLEVISQNDSLQEKSYNIEDLIDAGKKAVSSQTAIELEIFCPHCNAPVPAGHRVCGKCGKETGEVKIEISSGIICPQCRVDFPPGTEFCPVCGSKL